MIFKCFEKASILLWVSIRSVMSIGMLGNIYGTWYLMVRLTSAELCVRAWNSFDDEVSYRWKAEFLGKMPFMK